MNKIRYDVDPYNRLILDGSGEKSGLTGFRQVIDGRFKTDASNNLSYRVKAPLSKNEKIPHQIKLKGEWSLTDDHELRFTLDKRGRDTFGDQLTLQGEILNVDGGSLLFAATTRTKQNTRSTYVLNLSGSWKADKFNRLSFHVKREGGGYDILTFNGAWDIGKGHQIIYNYEKARLIRKKKQFHALTLKGRWDIRGTARLSYLLSGGTDSRFDFETSAGIFKEGYIKYELGIGASGRTDPVWRTVVLFGKWNLKRDVGLVFEIEYEGKKKPVMVFGADAKLTGEDTVSFRLRSAQSGREIGANLELSHKMLKGDGEAFLRILTSRQESAIYAGTALRW